MSLSGKKIKDLYLIQKLLCKDKKRVVAEEKLAGRCLGTDNLYNGAS